MNYSRILIYDRPSWLGGPYGSRAVYWLKKQENNGSSPSLTRFFFAALPLSIEWKSKQERSGLRNVVAMAEFHRPAATPYSRRHQREPSHESTPPPSFAQYPSPSTWLLVGLEFFQVEYYYTIHTAMTSRAGYVCCPPHSVFWKWNMIHQNDDDRAEWTERNMPVFFRLFLLFLDIPKNTRNKKSCQTFLLSSSSFFERLLYTRSHAVPWVSLVCWPWMREVAMNIYPVCRVFFGTLASGQHLGTDWKGTKIKMGKKNPNTHLLMEITVETYKIIE